MIRTWFNTSVFGWILIGVWIAAGGVVFVRIDARSHSVSDTLLGVAFPWFGLTVCLLAVRWLLNRNKPL